MIARVRSLLAAPTRALPGAPCTRETKRCAFWTDGPGYLRPACCTGHLLELTGFVHGLLDEHGILHWVDWGTLLGAVRGGEFIPWDEDVDFGIVDRDVPAIRALADAVSSAGYVMLLDNPAVIRIQLSEINSLHVDLLIWERRGDLMVAHESEDVIWLGMNGRTDFPSRYLDRLEPVTLHGRQFLAPSPVHDFLREHRYGSDYMTPTRPALTLGLDETIKSAEMTPAATVLLSRIAGRSELLLSLAESHSFLLRARIVEPPSGAWGMKWQLVAGLPLKPGRRHLAAARKASSGDEGPALEKLVASLAWIERSIEEYEHPPRSIRLRRACRRFVWFALALARKVRSR